MAFDNRDTLFAARILCNNLANCLRNRMPAATDGVSAFIGDYCVIGLNGTTKHCGKMAASVKGTSFCVSFAPDMPSFVV